MVLRILSIKRGVLIGRAENFLGIVISKESALCPAIAWLRRTTAVRRPAQQLSLFSMRSSSSSFFPSHCDHHQAASATAALHHSAVFGKKLLHRQTTSLRQLGSTSLRCPQHLSHLILGQPDKRGDCPCIHAHLPRLQDSLALLGLHPALSAFCFEEFLRLLPR